MSAVVSRTVQVAARAVKTNSKAAATAVTCGSLSTCEGCLAFAGAVPQCVWCAATGKCLAAGAAGTRSCSKAYNKGREQCAASQSAKLSRCTASRCCKVAAEQCTLACNAGGLARMAGLCSKISLTAMQCHVRRVYIMCSINAQLAVNSLPCCKTEACS
jgi:hypothetical protein